MKRFSLVLAVTLLASGVAMAVPTVTISQLDGTHIGPPPVTGEFQLTPNAELGALLGSSAPFQSFCVEVYEPITVGNTYEAVINVEAIAGDGLRPGETPGPVGDLLSPETAFLYTEFRNETLAGYEFTPGAQRAGDAWALQQAIWYLEGEGGYGNFGLLSPKAQGFVTAAEEQDLSGIGRVRILNLWDPTNTKAPSQDMLGMVIPAPGALLLASVGMGLVGYLRRRRSL